LAITSLVIGNNSAAMAERAAMVQARTSAREAAAAVQGRLGATTAALRNLADTMAATRGAGQALSRAQVSTLVKATLVGTDDIIGASVVWEPNALDGRDADYVGKGAEFDATGRYMPYFSRQADGIRVEPVVLSDAVDLYEIPKTTQRLFFSEPYEYPVNGANVLMASVSIPILIDGKFRGVAAADFVLARLSEILKTIRVVDGGNLALVSNQGMYASHPDVVQNGKKADDIPVAGLQSVRQGQPYEYDDSAGNVNLLVPMKLHPDIPPWAVRLSFPRSVALAPVQEMRNHVLVVVLLCSIAAAIVLVIVINRMMRPLKELSSAVVDVSEGEADLTRRLEVRGRDELAVISDGFNRFVARIHDVLVQVRSNAGTVATASREIRQGNSDLSARTEQQAASLEETSASMDEMRQTVGRNADHAAEAREMAESASEIARRAGAIVANVVDTMASIKDTASRVADIVGVIDGIAFQTNILALNAAVEAARAGEQGRGFAVVASEVRNLAQRSATAAREIKELIGKSVQEVGAGSMLVNEAGNTMHEVVTSVARVAQTIAAISNESLGQSAGIAQVSRAVSDMDEATQRNAALVEQVAAASDELERQMDMLVQLMRQFRVQSSDSSAAVPKEALLLARPGGE
jgi:methyl-accepting chemotaxis protein